MRKFVLFSMFGLLLASCTNQELPTNNNETTSDKSSFLSVSIVTTGTTGTRATGDYDPNKDDNANEEYRDGTIAESYVKDVLFLFFDKDGKPATATKENGKYLTYFLWENTNDANNGEDHGETVEKILKKTINIIVPQNQAKPAKLLVVVNPSTEDKTTLITKTLDELRATVENYESNLTARAENDDAESNRGKFVMTNSVFVDSNGIVDATILHEDNFCSTVKEAQEPEHQVVVYVERVVARIDLIIDIDSNPIQIGTGDNAYYIYRTGKNIPDAEKPNDMDQDVYVRLLGWNVFDTPDKSRLIKKVDQTWTDTGIFGTAYPVVGPWNSENYHRSFWAINPSINDFNYKAGKFTMGEEANDKDFNSDSQWTADHFAIPIKGKYTTVYFQENAAPFNLEEAAGINNYVKGAPIKPSKVILAAQLVDKEGKPRELAKWAGKYYTWDGLKAYLCNDVLSNFWYLYSTITEGGKTKYTYKQISPDDLDYETSSDSYKVTIVLSETGKKKSWYIGTNESDLTPLGDNTEVGEKITEAVNKKLAEAVGEKTVKLWKNGYTYFYLTIRHLGGEGSSAYYGIVRNHIYETTIKSLSGLGTPVADPQKDIVVTLPSEDDDESVLAAEVRILAWRVVRQDYDLTW